MRLESFESCGTWYCVIRWVVVNTTNVCSAFVFSAKQCKKNSCGYSFCTAWPPFFFISFIPCISLYPILISFSCYVTILLSFLFSSPWHYNIPSLLLFYPFFFLYVYILPSFLLYSFSYSFYLSVLMLNFPPHCNSNMFGFL